MGYDLYKTLHEQIVNTVHVTKCMIITVINETDLYILPPILMSLQNTIAS